MDKFKRDLILLNMVRDLGCIRIKALLDAFKTPEAVFNVSVSELTRVKGIGRITAESIKNAKSVYDIDKEVRLIEKEGVQVKAIYEEDYPLNLKQIYAPPVLLYVKGKLDKADTEAVAIVGSRRCTQYGIRTAQRLAKELSSYGITVISGLARGIDTAAHKGSVSVNGKTIAVLGNGLSSVYPRENKELADQIVKNGALISEFPMDMPPCKENFPQRNRIISGLSKGVVVIEAAEKSGALITADFALNEGRDVFAVPGPAGQATSKGTNRLIKEGAKLIEDAKDILSDMGVFFEESGRRKELIFSDPFEKSIYGAISDEPVDIDTIVETHSLNTKQAKTALLSLEVRGVIKQLPG
ncbi:MAG: DNA-processing protein DprA, partial [Candidatus Omnitrophota bacterium]